MTYTTQLPERLPGDGNSHEWKETHPAFGLCVVSHWHANPGVRLFGSDLVHGSGITLKFQSAIKDRGLSNDWHHGREYLLQVDMSHSQWSRLVSASGQGDGVPVTVNAMRTGPLVINPGIAEPEATRREQHGEEMAANLRAKLEAMHAQVDLLGAMLDGSISKRELRELHKNMLHHVSGLPGTVRFIFDQFAEATEKVAEDAKAEVEAHVMGVAQHLGLQSLADLPRLANRVEVQP